jgi:hypothetical protein
VLPWFVDVNGDRKPDLVVTHTERRELTVLVGDSRGAFTETSESPLDLGHSAWRMAVADLNGDGTLDVAAAAGDSVRVLGGDGRGGFLPAPGSPFTTGKGTWQLAVGDVNGDGKHDLAVSNIESDSGGFAWSLSVIPAFVHGDDRRTHFHHYHGHLNSRVRAPGRILMCAQGGFCS